MNLNIENQITDLIEKNHNIKIDFNFIIPKSLDHGDLTTNIALVLSAKPEFKTSHPEFNNPLQIAEQMKVEIENAHFEFIEKIEIAGAGFINFYLSNNALNGILQEVLSKKEMFGRGEALSGKKVMVEFTDPNPLKEFHIGHLYSNVVGEALARLFEAQGAEVWRVCYQGDVGLHVAKAIFGICQKLERENTTIETVAQSSLQERAKFLGQAYALGATAYETENTAKEKITEINKKIYDKDPEFYSVYEVTKKWSLEYFDSLYRRLGTDFARYYFESEAATRGMMVVRENMNKVFKNDEGTIIFPKEISGLHTRVFVNSQGLPTYEAKELGLAPWKYDEFPYDLSVIVTGNEINEYFRVLLKALSLIRPDLAERTRHISHGMVRLPSGKMSSRTGDVITGDSLLNTVRDAVLTKSKEENRLDEVSADVVGVAAIKYSLLKSQVGRDVTFNIDESIALDGNSGPYLQYAYVRVQGILNKSQIPNPKFEINSNNQNIKLEDDEKNIVRILAQFPSVVEMAQRSLMPSDIATYLYKLAKEFNLFYEKNKIIGDQREEIRLTLTKSVGQVLKNGLYLLGIKTVEKM